MKTERKIDRKRTGIVLGGALIAAAWLIGGPELLVKWGISGKANDLMVWLPAMGLYFSLITSHKNTMACEARAFKRLFGR